MFFFIAVDFSTGSRVKITKNVVDVVVLSKIFYFFLSMCFILC